MAIKLKKNSSEWDRDIEKISYRRARRVPLFLYGATFVFSFVVLLQNICLLNNHSNPHFIVELKSGNNETADLMNTVKQSLQVVTFFAEDFSFSNYTGANDIDSFDSGNIYELYNDGYHKVNEVNDYFMEFDGFDLFGCLVKDFGYQLSNISKAQDSEKLMNSLLLTYSHTISNLEEMYHESKKTGIYPDHFDDDKLRAGHKAFKVQKFGKMMKNYPIISCIISFISCVCLFILMNMAIFRNMTPKIVLLFGILQLPQTIFQFCTWSSELHYYYRISKPLRSTNIADFQLGSGFVYLLIMMVIVMMIQFILSHIFYLKRY